MATERELAALLETGLTGIAAVRWGWKAFETAELAPSLPLVTLQRTLASVGYADMCIDLEPLADTTIQVHTWAMQYEQARILNAQARAIVLGAGGWALLAEVDQYEPAFRAWRIAGDYLGAGMPVE